MIDYKGCSIFSYLDEELLVPRGTDEKLIKKLHNVFDEAANTRNAYYCHNRK